jgi:predicted GIY-YIG superfamily endonuclease
LTLIYEQEIGDRSLASKIESRVKRLTKMDKENNAILSARIRDFVGQCQAAAE